MNLSELIYRIEGETEEKIADSQQRVLIVTDEGERFEPEQVASDGNLLIINATRSRIMAE